MALVITFVPEPAKAVAEMARVVRPGGCVATYMWDVPGGGLPLAPIYAAMKALEIAIAATPSAAVSAAGALRALWEQAGLESVDARLIHVPVTFSSFDDFWDSNTVVGPPAKTIRELSPAARDRLKAQLRKQLPHDADGQITYQAHANAVKGRVPA
jgi:hypothetical protein